MYAKIFSDNFPDEGFTDGKLANGDEIYSFLTKNLGFVTDTATDEIIPGDFAIWYLAANEKFGELHVNEVVWKWSFGESNWDIILSFLRVLNEKNILSVEQYVDLIAKVDEGMKAFDDMYEIPAYLKAKRDGFPWTKKETSTKRNIKSIIHTLKCTMEEKGYRVIFPR
jgi:hypothetical protein